jgi:hypothetical protein
MPPILWAVLAAMLVLLSILGTAAAIFELWIQRLDWLD